MREKDGEAGMRGEGGRELLKKKKRTFSVLSGMETLGLFLSILHLRIDFFKAH